MINQVEYLGDGLYVKFDGYGINLLANSHEQPTDVVYLEPEVLTKFFSYVEKLKNFIAKFEEGETHE